jgi:hypothetical protein
VRLAARRAAPSLDRHDRSLKLGPSFALLGKVGGHGLGRISRSAP